ncbi:MAG: DUF4178 domain-containing protein [Armatimonadota bacterium]
MTLDLAPGTTITVSGRQYQVEEHSAFHEIDFRLDIVRLSGKTPADERWLVAVLAEPSPMLLRRLEQDWLAPPLSTIVHAGETYVNLYQGSAHRVRRGHGGARSKEGRIDFALFRANSGHVILTIGRNEEIEAWVGETLPVNAVVLPASAKS